MYKVASPEIIYQDVFKLKEVYELIHDWLVEEGYKDDVGGDKFIEKYYHERRLQGVGKEIRIWWRTQKTPAGGSTYFRYKLDVDFFVIAMKDVDVVKDGNKVRANLGELNVRVTGYLVVDPKQYIEKHPLLRPFKWVFEKIWMKKQREYHQLKILNKTNQLEAEIKTHLKLKNFMKEFEPYRPKY